MPKAYDKYPSQRGAGETSLYNPNRGTLDWESAMGQIDDTAQQAGAGIAAAVKSTLNSVVDFIKQTTGIDLSAEAALFEQLLGLPVDSLGGAPLGQSLDVLGQFLPFLSGADPATFDPITAAEQFIATILDPTGMLGSAASAIGDIMGALTGISAGTANDPLAVLTTFGDNLRAFLSGGNLASSSFDPLGALQQWVTNALQPAGVITSTTDLLPHQLGAIAPGASSNVAPPFNAGSVDGEGIFTWDNALAAMRTTGDGTLRQFEMVPSYPVTAGQTVTAGISTRWQNVAAAGPAITVLANFYDADDKFLDGVITTQISDPAVTVTSFNALVGNATAPAGATAFRLMVEVEPSVAAGVLWFKTPVIETQQRVDAGILGNMGGIPVVPPANVGGLGGSSLTDSFKEMWNKFASAFHLDLLTGQTLNDAAGAAQDVAATAGQASDMATTHDDVLNNAAVHIALQAATIATFHLSDLPHNPDGSLPTVTVGPGSSVAAFPRATGVTKQGIGFVAFIARAAAAVTGVYLNVRKVDPYIGNEDNLWTSGDIGALIPTGVGEDWVNAAIAVPLTGLLPADLLAFELVSLNSTIEVVAKQTNVPNLLGVIPPNMGATRSGITSGNRSPATISQTGMVFSGTIPWFCAGAEGVAVVTRHAPETVQFLTAGDHTYIYPSWFRAGIDTIDAVPCGGGGGGCGAFNTVPAGPGGNSSVTVDGVTTTGLGGAPGTNPTYSTGAGGDAFGPGDYSFNGKIYPGGRGGYQASKQPNYQVIDGTAPGGGGSAAEYFNVRAEPGHPGAWAGHTYTPSSTAPLTVHVGAAGIKGLGGSSPDGSNGGPGGVFITARQKAA